MIKSGKHILVILFLLNGLALYAQKVNYSGVPQLVIEGIRNKYPAGFLHKIKKRNGLFEAIIFLHSKKAEAEFDSNGAWLQTVTHNVEWKELPDTIRISFRKSDYWQWHINDIELIESPKKENAYVFSVKDVNPFDYDEVRPIYENTVTINALGRIVKIE